MSTGSQANRAAWANVAVPGLGIILIGRTWTGLAAGLLFTLCAQFAVWATLLIPDEFSPSLRGLAIGLAGGTYLGAQLRFAQTLRDVRRREHDSRRRIALGEARACLQREDYEGALEAIAPVRDCCTQDLLVAYRVAQILTGLNDVDAALRAWQQVRALDHHHVYRDEARACEQALTGWPPGPAPRAHLKP